MGEPSNLGHSSALRPPDQAPRWSRRLATLRDAVSAQEPSRESPKVRTTASKYRRPAAAPGCRFGEAGMRTNLPKLGVTWGNCAARPGCLGGLSNDSSIAAPLFLIGPDKPQGHRLFIATICHRP